jgi:hypothetical protein
MGNRCLKGIDCQPSRFPGEFGLAAPQRLGTVCPAQPVKIKPPITQIPIKVFILNIVFLKLRNLFFLPMSSTIDKLNVPLKLQYH